MNIELKSLSDRPNDIKKAKLLYLNAFPPEERPPFRLLSSRAAKGKADFLGIYDGEKCVGFFYVINYADLSYLYFFAIDEAERGNGYGHAALKELISSYPERRIFLAVEPIDEKADNNQDRIRRKRFYHECGFEELNLKLREANVVYDLLGIGSAPTKEEHGKMMDIYLGKLLRHFITMKIL